MKTFLHRAGLVTLTCLATALATTMSALPAQAEDIVVNIPVSNISQPIVLETTTTSIGNIELGTVTLPPVEGNLQVASQCVPVPEVGGLCIGSPTVDDQPPLEVIGQEELAPLVKWNDEARAALDWMIPEGVEFVRGLYDLPSDERILRYARPQLRSFMVARLQEIMDKKVYGVPLTEDEQNAFAFVEAQYLARNRLLAQAAYDEYFIFKSSPCTYRPPAAPESVKNPERMPKKVVDWCKLPNTQTSEAFSFVPPLPSPTQFTAWAGYRHASALGLDAFDEPITVKNLVDMTTVDATFGGFAVTAAAGITYATATALGNVAAIGLKVFPYAARPFFHAAAKVGGTFIVKTTSAAVGTLAVAAIAIAVIVFLVVTAVSIYLLIQHESVSQTLRARVDATLKSTDPFGLAPLTAEHSGKPLNSELDLDNPSAYRTVDSHSALAAKLAMWTTTYKGPPGMKGTSMADPSGVWRDNATTQADPTWLVRVGDAAPVERERLLVPHESGFASVRFSRGWMVVTRPGERPQAALQFGYLDIFGIPRLVSGAPDSTTEFVVSSLNARGAAVAARMRTLTFRNAEGALVRARLTGSAPTYLAGPRPAAIGPLFTGRPVLLRPNPVGTDGASLDEATVQDDYRSDWTVERLDPDTGQWSETPVPDQYGTSFIPTQPGEYDARVTMTSVDDPTQQMHGSVRFTVTPPPIQAPVLALQDNGSDRLELDLQFLQEVPVDNLDVEVTWPGHLGEETDPVQRISLDCAQTGPIECTTARTGQADALVFPVTPSTDLRRPVKVVATNSTGGTFEAEFHLGSGRPTVAGPPADVNAAEPGTVLVTESSTQITLPLDPGAGVQSYVAASLVPSPGGSEGFGLVDPATGNTTGALLLPGLNQGVAQVLEDQDTGTWYLHVRGIPDTADIGSFDVPLVVSQTNGSHQLVHIVVHIVPSTEDRYRGALQSTVDPDDFTVATPPVLYPMVLGGRVSDPRYTGEMCVSLQHRDFGQPAKVRCGPLSDFVNADGVARRLPYAKLFPAGMRSGIYRAEAWLNTSGLRVDTAPMGTTFLLAQDATYPRPKVALGAPVVRGKPAVRSRLRAVITTVDPDRATLRYTWLRNGKRISGATGRTYQLRRQDRGDRISVRVVATFPQWTTTTRTSARTRPVR